MTPDERTDLIQWLRHKASLASNANESLLSTTADELERLAAENERLKSDITHQNRKMAHRCIDAYCPLCDVGGVQ